MHSDITYAFTAVSLLYSYHIKFLHSDLPARLLKGCRSSLVLVLVLESLVFVLVGPVSSEKTGRQRTATYRDTGWSVNRATSRCRLRHRVVHRVEVVGCHSGAGGDAFRRARRTSNILTTDPTVTSHRPLARQHRTA